MSLRAQRAVVEALADTLFPPETGQPEVPLGSLIVPEALEDLAASMEPGDRRQLGVGLRLLDLGALPLFGRPFSRLAPEQRERYLRGLMRSRFTFGRSLYRDLRDLFCSLYYADRRSWPLIGYPGPRLEDGAPRQVGR